MKKILVPCDFSKPAVNAFRLALDLAAQSHGTIHLLHVIELPVVHDRILMPVLNFEEQLLKEMREKAEGEFTKIIAKYNKQSIKVTVKVLFGAVVPMILGYITDQSVDSVLMGSHGVSGLREVLIGSNAERIVRRSPVPVLIVKDHYKGPVKNIVFPISPGAENEEALIAKIKTLQEFFKARLHIVWINTPLNFTSDTITLDRLEGFAKSYKLKDYTINVFNHHDGEEGILAFTKLIKGDLIAMGTHGRRGVAHLIEGSLAEDVVNHTEKLVWTYSLNHEAIPA
jgi:nucleotide-binding universal stress UspA family protein